ncbi:putative membrane protein [Actinoplanes lutulentus]|nr:DUF4142 domain-containing protein [Actinoplanes lutulentus]MBB2945225.1 putative membrane protein [Actinoplanes lutulentus]
MPLRRFFAILSSIVLIGLASPAQARPITPDADFLIAAHQGNLTQIKLGKIAKHQGTTDSVRTIARDLAAYHRKLDVAVRTTATRLDVKLPAEPNSEQRTLIQQHESTSGAAFDTLFLGSQLIAHERAIKLALVVIDTGAEPKITRLAAKALPIVQSHQQVLVEAQQKLTGR